MSAPGWYPDPAGVPGRFRHWDGNSWSAQTTNDPATPPPVGPLAPSVPPTPRGPKWPWIVGSIAVVAVLAALLVGMWRLTADDTPTTSPEPTPTGSTNSTASPTPGSEPSEPIQASCSAGVGSVDNSATSYEAAGLRYAAVPGWGFRFDRDQWMWVDEVAAWGKLDQDSDFAAGIVFGELRRDNGFVDLVDAVSSSFECLQNYGPWDPYEFQWNATVVESSVAGMPAIEVHAQVTPGPDDTYPGYDLHNVVIATDDPEAFALWISFVPTGDNVTKQEVAEAFASLQRV